MRIKNLMLPGVEGGYTVYFGNGEVPAPDKEMTTDKGGKPTFIYDACVAYKKEAPRSSSSPVRNTARAPAATGPRRARTSSA